MTSQINYNGINAAYPVAGQDNDSQGFRDNFSVIKIALNTASSEISDLQLNTAKLNDDNDFDGNAVTGATLYNNRYKSVEWTVGAGNLEAGSVFNISYAAGDYHIISLSTSTNFQFTNWPTSQNNERFGKLRLQITPTTATNGTFYNTLTINFTSPIIGSSIRRQVALPYTATTVLKAWTQMWDVWSYNEGQDTYVQFLGTWTNS